MTNEQIRAELSLFKCYTDTAEDLNISNTINLLVMKNTLQKGVLLRSDNYPTQNVIDLALDMYGLNPEQLNKTFHKSFATVRDSSIYDLIIQQIIHYITTYGYESLGIYNEDTVYIPKEKLEIPELQEDLVFTVISYINERELSNKIMDLLTSGIALSKETLDNIMILSDYIDKDRFDEIKNKEIKIALYDKYNVVPKNNIEFLRYLIYKTIGSTLLINNVDTIKAIKKADKEKSLQLLQLYVSQPFGYKSLGDIMLRYKNLFLAFKCKEDVKDGIRRPLNNIINKIDAISRKHHKRAKYNLLDHLTEIKSLEELNLKEQDIYTELNNVTSFKIISILNMLMYKLSSSSVKIPKVYTIRNGKIFVEEVFGIQTSTEEKVIKSLYNIIYNYLLHKLHDNLDGKTIYIPKNVTYMLPASEKRFLNNIPEGSYITIDRHDAVVGINWNNINGHRVDLDLKLQNESESYGWNTYYRSDTSKFYFSGDITDAEDGATEVFYMDHNCEKKAFFLTVTDYTSIHDQEIPFKFIVAKVKDNETINQNYVIDPNQVLLNINTKLDKNEFHKLLALISIEDEKIKVIFKNNNLEKCRVSMMDDYKNKALQYFDNYSKYQLTLNDILKDLDITISETPYIERFVQIENNDNNEPIYKKEKVKVDIDLSLETLSKDTIINILK